MSRKSVEVTGDAPIPNKVDPDSIKNKMSQDHFVSKFAELGKILLAETNRPNVITLEEFTPFIPLFNMDKHRFDVDSEYELYIKRLYNNYVKGLSINLYEPTIVIVSREDPRECAYLDRCFTRIKSDNIEGESHRTSVPSVVSKASNVTRDDLLLEASLTDITQANITPEQKEFFARTKVISAFIQNRFAENNLSENKRMELLNDQNDVTSTIEPTSGSLTFELDDD